MKTILEFLADRLHALDAWDWLGVVGLSVFALGLLAIYPPAALLFVGAMLLLAAMGGANSKRKKGG